MAKKTLNTGVVITYNSKGIITNIYSPYWDFKNDESRTN